MTIQNDMDNVMKILKEHRHEFIVPSLTEISEHHSNDPFKVLVSCILSLRTRDETTSRISEQLYKIADNPYRMAKLSSRQIGAIIKPVNYYKTKARRIRQICIDIITKHDGKVPHGIDELMKFKGVGRKTANIVMVYGFKKHGIPVDTHVHRVSNRLGWVSTKQPEKTEQALRTLLPKKYWIDLNDLFVQFGQNICKPVNPKCGACPISKYCKYYRETYQKR